MNRNILKAKMQANFILEVAEVIDSLPILDVDNLMEEAALDFIVRDLKEAENIITAFYAEAVKIVDENPSKFESFIPNPKNEREYLRWATLTKRALILKAYNEIIKSYEYYVGDLRGRILKREEIEEVVDYIAGSMDLDNLFIY